MERLVFEGIKVLDFTVGAVGTLATKYLADYGATVLHVESETAIEVCRRGPPFKGGKPGVNNSAWMPNFNGSKYGITLNIRHPKGKEVARRLVAWADMVSNNMPSGTMERWGLGYEDLKKIKPDIIAFISCMQGDTGPYRAHPGYGNQLAALTGITNLSGWPDRDPSEVWMAYTDFVCPRFIGATLIAALDYRRRTGKGQLLDFSQCEESLQHIAPLILDYTVNGRVNTRMGNRSPYAAPHGIYRCLGEDRWVAIAVQSDKEWESLGRVIGEEWAKNGKFATLLGRLENEDELNGLVEGWTAKRTAEEVMGLLQGAGVSAGVVSTGQDLDNDPQLKHRDFFHMLEHSEIGPLTHYSRGFKLSKTNNAPLRAGPCLGEHNEYAYKELLGLSDDEFIEYLVEGAFE